MAKYERIARQIKGTSRRRLASWLVFVVALIAILVAVWPARANAKIAPLSTMSATFAAPADDTMNALRSAMRVTRATYTISSSDAQPIAIDAAFQAYYEANDGAESLGAPLTLAFPTQQGLTQFFTYGELILHAASTAQSPLSADEPQNPGAIEENSLLDDLLQLGSTAPVGGETSSLTFLDLRRAALSAPLLSATALQAASIGNGEDDTDEGSTFVASASNSHEALGHLVPAAIWSYLQQSSVSPNGWQLSYGAPLTEALPMIVTVDGTLRRELVQLFAYGAVVIDETGEAEDAADEVSPLPTGLAYLETVGMPSVTVRKGTAFWATQDTALLQTPGGADAEVHIGQNFPLTLTGQFTWLNGALWYRADWKTPGRSGTGWIAATDGTQAAPDPGSPPTSGFDLLSPELEQYLAQYGARVGASVYDITRNTSYSYNSSGLFTVASSVKVPIMLTFLTMTERQGREPNDGEMQLLTTMIENSNNDSAQALWDEVGGGPAVASYLRSVGVTGFQPNDIDGWGWSRISPLSMVHLLTLLHNNAVLTAQDRQTALYLMNHIQLDEQTGVGDTAPDGATVAMKDGWVTGPDGLWVMNTTGIVTVGGETYIISVYTQDDASLEEGWDITRHVCQIIGDLLA